jgi:endogenous inhibitor of DNA gyrase (YacG/DUF329 family)
MGMYNWVRVKLDCPYCGKEIRGTDVFQTKDDSWEDLRLVHVDYHTVDEFHAPCPHCEKWIEYVKKPVRVDCLEDFELKEED